MMRLINWIKQNKLASFLLALIGFYLVRNYLFGVSLRQLSTSGLEKSSQYSDFSPPAMGLSNSTSSLIRLPVQDYAPQPEVKDRLVIQESYLSLLVKNVVEVRGKIIKYAQESGGYMVSANTSNPQDAPTATIVVRVSSNKLEDALTFFRGLSVKVVSENLIGQDVTDQYVDIDTRIAQLEKTKKRLEDILSQATQITDITNITQQIINYQVQIDSLKGQQDALKKNAQLAKLTIYLSTDEMALPYTPSETFRPAVIFKLAVRSLVGTLRKLATYAIWAGVYSVIWVPAIGIYVGARKWLAKRKAPDSKSPR